MSGTFYIWDLKRLIVKIYHNTRCRKSRETLAIIEKSGNVPEIINYLDTPPTKKELKDILTLLNMSASQLVRKSEPIFKSEFKGKTLTENQWIDAMIKHPKLMERPIVVKGRKAVIGRPPEAVNELL